MVSQRCPARDNSFSTLVRYLFTVLYYNTVLLYVFFASCVADKLQELNSMVTVKVQSGELTEAVVGAHGVVVMCGRPVDEVSKWDAFCHVKVRPCLFHHKASVNDYDTTDVMQEALVGKPCSWS